MITDDDALEALEAYRQHGTLARTAEALGQSLGWVQRRVARAAERGLDGSGLLEEVGAGRIPPGFRIRGISANRASDGSVSGWIKTEREEQDHEALNEALEAAFGKYKGLSQMEYPKGPDGLTRQDQITVYPIADLHLGLYAWKPETGEDYDVDIAEKRLLGATKELMKAVPFSKKGVILNLGDFLHSDNNENRTLKSGNPLDVDTRYARVLETGVRLLISVVDLALQKHDEVEVRCLAGNHDPYGAIALAVALRMFYSNNPRVHVDKDPSYFWHYRHGQVLLTATHGDMVKPADIPGVVASYWPQDWGATKWRFCYMGHVHHTSKGGGEQHGLVWETFQSLTAKDVWHRQSGYSSGQSMVAITHGLDRPEIQRLRVSV